MEIFISNIWYTVTPHTLKRTIAKVLHGPDFQSGSAVPINFEVVIFRQNAAGQLRCGVMTLPTLDLGLRFLQEFQNRRGKHIVCGPQRLVFNPGKREPPPEVLHRINALPYVDPQALEEHDLILQELPHRTVDVTAIQFGWDCRDGSFSIEWEKECVGILILDLDKREFRVNVTLGQNARVNHVIGIRSAQITSAVASTDPHLNRPCLFLSLQHPPSFTSDAPRGAQTHVQKQRWSALTDDHIPFVSYTSLAVRFVFTGDQASENVNWMLSHCHLRAASYLPAAHRLGLFSIALQEQYKVFLSGMQWEVAFQVDALIRDHILDLKELISLQRHITYAVNRRGTKYAVGLIRYFNLQAREPVWKRTSPNDIIQELWLKCRREFKPEELSRDEVKMKVDDTFPCLHVTITPTTMYLDGPFPERSNRVMRQFADHYASFLRVNFVDEGGFSYHMDRDVDDREFIHRRFGGVLRTGFTIAGRHFEFLAYSQSGLKEHTVWFMSQFSAKINDMDIDVTPDYIISSIGLFDRIEYDPKLLYCPARWGARISQAFTATEAAVSLEIEEIYIINDIYDAAGHRTFTDGIGTVSPELARDMWKGLQSVSRRHAHNHHIEYPPAFQIRCQGSKGMISVDYQLSGRQLCLRQSMIKFEATHSAQLEIVAAFTSPGKFYLNRPLIMMLEDLHIAGGYDVLKRLQNAVVKQTEDALRGLNHASTLVERYGLGTAFKLSSIFLNLHKLGVTVRESPFHLQLIDFAVHHVLRELKYHARIPVPEGWTLPGVADIHGFLKEGQVFACITSNDGKPPLYVEGPVMIFRSPVIHPGDIQIAQAIGAPPVGSPFMHEPLANCVVFSTKGSRPLPSCLAGGDLDGDVFVVSTLPEMLPTEAYEPADYLAAERKTLDRPSTRQDIADFITEFLYSNNIGIIAHSWLLRVDQSDEGITDESCLDLAQLHSDAVDYPKTGNPVPIQQIPRLKSSIKPDWDQPELLFGDSTKLFYESQRWLGRLYREIKLPDPPMPKVFSTSGRHDVTLERVLDHFHNNVLFKNLRDSTLRAVRQRVMQFVSPWRYSRSHIYEIWPYYIDFAHELQIICVSHTVSSSRSATLTEEEAIVGTIVAKCAVARKRKDRIAQLREQTAILFDRIATQIVGPKMEVADGIADIADIVEHAQSQLKRAWIAYLISVIYCTAQYFGSRAFGLIALSEVFDAIKQLEAAGAATGTQENPISVEAVAPAAGSQHNPINLM